MNQRKRAADGREKRQEVTKFEVGQYVLLKYPNKLPDKLAALYRGPMEIVAMDRPDIVKVRDLTTDKVSVVHTSRLRLFRHPAEMTLEELEVLGIDVDDYFVDGIVDHEERGQNVKNWKFRVRWLGYAPDEDSCLNWNEVKDWPDWISIVNYGTQIWLKIMQESTDKGRYPGKRIYFSQMLQEFGYTLRKLGFGH